MASRYEVLLSTCCCCCRRVVVVVVVVLWYRGTRCTNRNIPELTKLTKLY